MESAHPSAAPAAHAPAAAAAHTTPRTYVIVFVWLTVMTALEVAIAASPIAETVKIALLVVLAVIKAALVVLFYMHLLHDSKWYWIIFLVPVFFVALLTRYLIVR